MKIFSIMFVILSSIFTGIATYTTFGTGLFWVNLSCFVVCLICFIALIVEWKY